MSVEKDRKSLISVIIPAFKQEKTIVKDIREIENALLQMGNPYEIIVVVDGKVDGTFENASRITSKSIKVVGYENNHGKGYAIRFGMIQAKGDIIGFIDGGMDLHPGGLSMLLNHMEWYNADIIVGSKRHPVSEVKYPLGRRVISFLSQIFIRFLFGLKIKDTQVGMKFFKRRVLQKVMPRLLVKQYAFDIEILVVANYLGFKKIYEAPIRLRWTIGSGITTRSLWKVLFLTLWDTLAIFYRLKILRYYDTANKRRWKFDPELNFRVNLG